MASYYKSMVRAVMSVLASSALIGSSLAQTAPDCPLWGPVYPAPVNVLKTIAVPNAVSALKESLGAALESGALGSANTSFHLSVFSSDDLLVDFSYASPGADLTLGVLDRNTIFRTGSLSKFLTVYVLLIATGMRYINDPITKWVPELAAAESGSEVSVVRWQEITIGALASHMAGLSKDVGLFDLSRLFSSSVIDGFGLPPLAPGEKITCGTDPQLPPCSREEFFNAIKGLHPVTSAFNMPIYANPTFQILAYAMESMTDRTFADIFQSRLVGPLKLNGTSLGTPAETKSLNAIIPGGEIDSGWRLEPGDNTSAAAGLTFSTGADFTAIGQSVLSSSLLPRDVTRRWLKPTSNTPDLRFAAGMPWEILRVDVPVPTAPSFPARLAGNDTRPARLVDLYTKNGGIGAYHAQFALSPDHGFGFVVFVAGPPAGADGRFADMMLVNRLTSETLLPAFEAAGLEQAVARFGGTYATATGNATLTVVAGDGGLGLGVRDWRASGRDLLKSYFGALHGVPSEAIEGEPRLRLYPVGLDDGKQIAFRGVYDALGDAAPFPNSGRPFAGACAAWASVGEPPYGNIGLDDFVFDIDAAGKATAITARGARQVLLKQA